MSTCERCGKTFDPFGVGYHDYGFLCLECRSIESERHENVENMATAAVFIAHAKNNPGDYVCPSCLFQTLKRWASRCPKCHADPGSQYWADVAASERALEMAAAAERERERPIREAQEAWQERKKDIYSIIKVLAFVFWIIFFGDVTKGVIMGLVSLPVIWWIQF